MRGSVWREVESWTATVSMIAGVTPSTSPEPRSARSTSSTTRCVEQVRRPCSTPSAFGVDGFAVFDRDPLVARAERTQHRRTDRAAHRVAGTERGRDDRRREHQADDDQQAATAATAGVAHTEPEEHEVADRERGEHRDAEPDEHRRATTASDVDREPEHARHRAATARLRSARRRTRTSYSSRPGGERNSVAKRPSSSA